MRMPFSSKSDLEIKKIYRSIHPVEIFSLLLARERARADRNGTHFALMMMRIEKNQDLRDVKRLICVLRKRIRSIDGLGWLKQHQIGLILPNTDYEGAAEVARDLRRMLSPENGFFTPRILTYPESEVPVAIDRGNADSGQERIFHYICPPLPVWKRTLDILGASVALIVLFPVLLLTALFIKCVSPGPVLFRQKRVGLHGTSFTCLKFRSMAVNADPQQHRNHVCDLIRYSKELAKIDHQPDASVIPCGNLLRSLGIDELPQLINVLKGDMSLIGPRPCLAYESAEFANWHHRRFDVHPGLTGLWQVSGKNKTTFEEMMRLDIKYGLKRTLIRDVVIVFKTFPLLFQQLMDTIKYRKRGRA